MTDIKLYSVKVTVSKSETYIAKRWAENEENAKALVESDMKSGRFNENPVSVDSSVTMVATEEVVEDDLK